MASRADLHLGWLVRADRATSNESTRLIPNMLAMGREKRLPAVLVFGSTNTNDCEEINTHGDYDEILRAMLSIHVKLLVNTS